MKKTALFLLIVLHCYAANAQNWDEVIKTIASDRTNADQFGYAVSISGNYAVVGAWTEDHDASGANSIGNAGSAYIFERDGSGNWNEAQKIVASDRASSDYFGAAISISGNHIIIGVPSEDEDASGGSTMSNAGSAYIFERDGGGNWIEVQKIVASDRAGNDRYGNSVSISGSYAIVGAYAEDEDASGGNTMNAPGSAYIYARDSTTGTWNQIQKIVASDRADTDYFGYSVSISGDYAVVGAHLEDHTASGTDSMESSGSVYIFERNGGGNWIQEQKIVASDRDAYDRFGYSLAISGDYVIAGAYQEDEDEAGANTLSEAGSAYIFERDGNGDWNQAQKVTASDRASDDEFGYSVSISGSYAIVGAYLEDEDSLGANTINAAGSAYIYERDNSGNWNQFQKIVNSDREQADQLAWTVSISGHYAIIGAHEEDEDASGANSMNSAGSAYILEKPCPVLDTSISASGSLLTSNANGVEYQWIDCGGLMPISGATSQVFNATATGSYAVSISQNGCGDTSNCYSLILTGIPKRSGVPGTLIYPNPFSDETTLRFSNPKGEAYTFSLHNVLGREVKRIEKITTSELTITRVNLTSGLYFFKLEQEEGTIISGKLVIH